MKQERVSDAGFCLGHEGAGGNRGFNRLAFNVVGKTALNWDAQEKLTTPTAPPLNFGLCEEPCVWRITKGPDAGGVGVSLEAVAECGSEWWALEIIYTPKYLQAHKLEDEGAVLEHARTAARERLCGCAGARPRSNGERVIVLRFDEDD